jgi:hypothetical protein
MKIRAVVTFEVPSELHAISILNSMGFKTTAGQSIATVASSHEGAEINPKWNEDGYHVTTHVHRSTRDEPCPECEGNARDRIR